MTITCWTYEDEIDPFHNCKLCDEPHGKADSQVMDQFKDVNIKVDTLDFRRYYFYNLWISCGNDKLGGTTYLRWRAKMKKTILDGDYVLTTCVNPNHEKLSKELPLVFSQNL